MSQIDRVGPDEAQELIEEGYTFVDVRTEREFEQGHPPGAVNVPVMLSAPGGMQANPDFSAIMRGAFESDARLLIGCRSGGRSLRAAQMLIQAGFSSIKELRTGWEGGRDAFGRPEPGWRPRGLPVETGAPAGQRYADLRAKGAS